MPDGSRSPLALVAAAMALMLHWLVPLPAVASVEVYEEQNQVAKRIGEQLGRERSFALVIGISEFDEGETWSRLSGIEKEIADVKLALDAHGFTIAPQSTPEDPENPEGDVRRLTKKELKSRIKEFVTLYGKRAENRLIIYIATHGTRDRTGKGDGYLVTSDSPAPDSQNFAEHAYSVNDLTHALAEVQAQHIYMFFNACFSGAMVPRMRAGKENQHMVKKIKAPDLSPEVADWTLTLLAHNARLVLTAGSDDQEVPDLDNPFSKAFTDGLNGEADGDGDGLILGTELATYVTSRVARETRRNGTGNDPVFAIIPKTIKPENLRPDVTRKIETNVNYADFGYFVFLSPRGAGAKNSISTEDAILAERLKNMDPAEFTDCADCPVMVKIADKHGAKMFAMARTETTFAEWDACFRDLACHRYIDDGGLGRGDRPVHGITWIDQRDFIEWLKDRKRDASPCKEYQLPTAAQWTYSAKGLSMTRFAWGEELIPDRAVCWGCGEGLDGSNALRTASFNPNGFGLYDMTGNLWEWIDTGDCDDTDIMKHGKCTAGTVMGGAYSTSESLISAFSEGKLPRTGNQLSTMYSLPTVGFRAACELKGQ